MSTIVKNKKLILIGIGILLLPFIMAFLQIAGEILFEGGRIVGNFIRTYTGSCVL